MIHISQYAPAGTWRVYDNDSLLAEVASVVEAEMIATAAAAPPSASVPPPSLSPAPSRKRGKKS